MPHIQSNKIDRIRSYKMSQVRLKNKKHTSFTLNKILTILEIKFN